MRTFSTLKALGLLSALPALLTLSACDRHEHDTHFGRLERVEVRDRATNTLYAVYVRSQGQSFTGPGVPHLGIGEERALDVLFFDGDDRQAALGGSAEYSVGVRLAEARDGVAGTPGIVRFEAHGDHVDVEGVAEGETHLVLQLMHGTHSDGDSPALRLHVHQH